MRKLIVGQIMINQKLKGTGFLINSDIVVTAKHNVFGPDDALSESYYEKEVVFKINNDEEIVGTTVNLVEATCNFDREQNFTKILHEKTTADRLI